MDKGTPLEVRETFERWMLDDDSREHKDAALESIWDNMSLADAAAPEDPYMLIKEAESLENSKSVKAMQRRSRWLWAVSAIAACMTVFAVFGWMNAGKSETCIASSDMSKAEFVLPDGSKVWLNKGSRLSYLNDLEGKYRKVRLEGEGYFDVAHDARHPFIVEAGEMSIRVRGTMFTVSAYEGKPVKAFLEEGSIVASVKGYDDIALIPDQAVVYDPSFGRFESYDENSSDHTAWIDGKLEFVNKPLVDIFDCLSHWYGVDIVCNDMERASDIRLSMTIRQEPVEEIFEAICSIADVTFFIDSHGDIKLSFIK